MPGTFGGVKSTPLTRLAARLYATGAAKTKKDASIQAGLHPSYLSTITSPKNGSDEVLKFMTEVDEILQNRTIDESKLLTSLQRHAIEKIGKLMQYSESDAIQLKAAIDLADRGPNTSKIQKHQISAITVSGRDIAALTQAMVESAKVKEQYAEMAQKDFIKVNLDAAGVAIEALPEETKTDG